MPKLHFNDLPVELQASIRRDLGIRSSRSMTMDEVRRDPVDAINAVSDIPEKSILVLNDFHQFLGDAGQPASPLITRSLKEKVREARTAGKVIIILGCTLGLPLEIEKEFTVIEYELPGSKVLAVIAEVG